MKGRGLYRFLMLCVLADSLFGGVLFSGEVKSVYAAVAVADEEELKNAMEQSGKTAVYLTASFSICDTIYVKGEKTLNGNGYVLSRFHKGTDVFGGTLFCMVGAELHIHNTTLAGGGDNDNVRKKIYGRLLDVEKGNVFLEKGAVLTKNINRKQNNDGGGAIAIRDGGKLIMKDGKISKNQNVYGGAGVHIDKGGSFMMRGGMITENQSWGIGAVEDFDGRGGAISNRGKVTISGGSICRNRVKGYTSTGISYGGVGGMLYNQGECRIQGGTIKENGASYGGGAVYNDRKSKLQIMGGTICDNDAGLGEGLFLAGGSCRLGNRVILSSIYIAKDAEVIAEPALSVGSNKISVVLEHYKTGSCVVRAKKMESVLRDVFSLYKKSRYILICRSDGLYLGRKTKKNPIKANGKNRFVKQESAQKKKSTKGRGEQFNKKDTAKKNQKQLLMKTAPRFFFVWEIRTYAEEDWKEELLKGCMISCHGQEREDMKLRWRWKGLLKNAAGSYPVEVSVNKGEWAVIPVTLVQESTKEKKTGYVRFLSTDTEQETAVELKDNTVEEIWYFTPQDILDGKEYMKKRKDPFSSETNQAFLRRFQKCRSVRRNKK